MTLPQLEPPADSSELLWSHDEALARMFAASARFQKEVGTDGDIAQTLNKHVIDWAAVDPENSVFEKARVLIEYGAANRRLDGHWTSSGVLMACIEYKLPLHEDNSAGYRTAKNQFMRFVSAVLTEIEDRSKNASETILGFNPRRFNSYDIIEPPDCIPASEVCQVDQDTDPLNVWYLTLSFAI